MKLLQQNSIPVPVELATQLRDALKTRASDAAIFLQQLHYWTEQKCGRIIDGVRWIWNTYAGWLDNFKWWTEWDFRVITKKLRELGLVQFCQPNDHERDRTGHYRLNYEHEWLKDLVNNHPRTISDGAVEQSPVPFDNCTPDITKTTSTTTSNKKADVEKSFPQEEEQQEDLVDKYYDKLKYVQVYPLIWQSDILIENPKFEPVRRALKKVPPAVAERGIKAFLSWIRNKTDKQIREMYGNNYGALEAAIVKRWN